VILGVELVSEAEKSAPFLIMIIESNYYLFGAILLPTQTMWLSPIFERFVEKSPITVIIRAMMEVIKQFAIRSSQFAIKTPFL
jgi:hypothetical protein